ncbi:MAG: PD40 domain-containing protein [Planctomycetes bacterium]|nr:PD40 domain-containing protein [Planctomycetota bacterium]
MFRASLYGVFVAFVVFATAASAGTTIRVSIGPNGEQGNSFSGFNSISADGRYIAFESNATNFAPNDTNGFVDVFVRDVDAATLEMVSLGPGGILGDGISMDPWITADGRYISFTSFATNLVAGDTNGRTDIFVRDRQTNVTSRVSVDSAGNQTPGNSSWSVISSDGRYVCFQSDSYTLVPNDNNLVPDVYVRDRVAGTTARVSVDSAGHEANGESSTPSMSSDGRYIAFESQATNLVANDTNGLSDVFVHDRVSGTTVRASVSSTGVEGDDVSGTYGFEISPDGRYVAFASSATNLVPNDANGRTDIFVRDLVANTTSLVSLSGTGAQAELPCISPSISSGGLFVAFETASTNLIVGDTNNQNDVFVRDVVGGTIERVSEITGGVQARLESRVPELSATGRYVSFKSLANLVPEDTNTVKDVYRRDRGALQLSGVSPATGSESGGDLVKIAGCGFTNLADTSVLVGGAAATVVAVSNRRIDVRTPPGSGIADVVVTNSNGTATRTGAYTYVNPIFAARYGTVNVARGDRENVLFVNDGVGDATTRELTVAVNHQITVRMASPSSRATARYALYAWSHPPTLATLSSQPFGLGTAAMPTPLSGGSPQPFMILNNLGHPGQLGVPNAPSSRAPSVLGSRTITRRFTLTLQGLIQDDGSASPQRVSVTNAVVTHIQ